jgi:uncharacterized protein
LETIVDDSVSGESYAVVCHPHPKYGGTMENKVVTTVARALRDANMPTLRFNFRGVGASAGAFDQGLGETEDADAVASWGARRWPGKTLVIAGFSFGGYVALQLALKRKAARLITIAPAIQLFERPVAGSPDCPWLIVQGDEDDMVDPKEVAAWARSFRPAPLLVVLPGVGHFFHGHLHELHDAVTNSMPKT